MNFSTMMSNLGLTSDELRWLMRNPQFPPSLTGPTFITGTTNAWDFTTITFDDTAAAAFVSLWNAVAAQGWVVLSEGLGTADFAKLATTPLPLAGRPFVDFGPLVRMSIPLSKITAPTTVSGRVEIYRRRIRDGAPLPPLALWRSPGGVDSWSIVSGRDLYQAASLEGLTALNCVIANCGPASTAEAAQDLVP